MYIINMCAVNSTGGVTAPLPQRRGWDLIDTLLALFLVNLAVSRALSDVTVAHISDFNTAKSWRAGGGSIKRSSFLI